jgi:N-acetylglucosamine kinase-like BadF-type ATPase
MSTNLSHAAPAALVGVDVGGTFTDAVVVVGERSSRPV